MTRYHARVDRNHGEIVDALRKAGAFVQSLASVGHGVPDLLVGFRGEWALLEVKDGKQARLTDDEYWWHQKKRGGPTGIVRSAEEAISFLQIMGGQHARPEEQEPESVGCKG